jgi:hypothetical protein
MSEKKPVKRKRSYRYRVVCSICQKEIVAEYQDVHAKTKHKGKDVKFTIAVDSKQTKLCFGTGGETVATPKKCKNDCEKNTEDNEAEGNGSDPQTSLTCVTETLSSAENIEGRDAEIAETTESSVESVCHITVASSIHNIDNNEVQVEELPQNDMICSSPTTGCYINGKMLALSKYVRIINSSGTFKSGCLRIVHLFVTPSVFALPLIISRVTCIN